MTPERLGLLWGITVFAGAGARLLAVLTGFPGVVLLLLSGLLIGRSGLGLVEPLDLGQGLETIVGLLVSLVLFDGGLRQRLTKNLNFGLSLKNIGHIQTYLAIHSIPSEYGLGLSYDLQKFKASSGEPGGKKNKNGRRGNDLEITLPFACDDRLSSSSLTVTSPCASVPAVIAFTW